MQYPTPPDVQDLIAAQLATGRYQNEDEVLREALQASQEASDDAVEEESFQGDGLLAMNPMTHSPSGCSP